MNTLERVLIEKAGCEHGWENIMESHETAVVLASARHRAHVRISANSPSCGWIIAVPEGLVHQELARSCPEAEVSAGSFTATDMDQLSRLLRRTAELACSLPNQAAQTFASCVTEALNKTETNLTEIERLVRQRVGQDIFRQALMDYWGGACAVTGVCLPDVLRASHAKPWAVCDNDEERLDVFNGFLLTANLDALFDRGLITFADSGHLVCSPRLVPSQLQALNLDKFLALRWLAPEHRPYLIWHREQIFKGK